MNKTPPNLDLIYDKVLDFNESQPDDYFDSVIQHLSENTPQVRNVFDNLIGVFSNNPSLLNALRIIFLFIYRLGAPAFFSLESSKVLELQLDPSINSPEILEIKRITKYCVEKFQKMQAAHEIPNIGHKYAELCNLLSEDPQIPDTQLTEFEKQYSELSVKFQQAEQRLEVLISDNHGSSGPFDTSRIAQLLEQIDGLMIQPDLRFTKAENELILNFFHQRYALINRIQNEFPQVVQDYHFMKEEKRAKILQEKGEELQTENNQKQVQEVQNLKDFTFFIEGTSLAAFPESMTVEYKDYIYPFSNDTLKKKLKASICAFLNTNGGRILIGVRNTGFRVKGLFLTTNDQDNLIRDVDALLREFHPKVDPEEVTTTFIPIKKTDGTYKPGFYVVKILVRRGKPNELYFTAKDCYKRRNGQNESQMPATFKRDIIDRHAVSIQTHPELYKDKGEFNDPLPELGMPVTNIKEQGPKDGKTPKFLGGQKKHQQQQEKQPSSHQKALAAPTQATKFLVKNVPNLPQPEVAQELKHRFDSISPSSKTLHFVKDEIILTFVKPEEARAFLDLVEKNPIIIGSNTLEFAVKPTAATEKQDKPERQEKFDKVKNKLEVDEEKKDPVKAKADASSIIWVRGIPDNTPELKEKLTALLGDFAQILKDMKIHNKKKRATLEFENSMQANEVLAFLTLQDRFIDETKVTFEKASPPSSPSHSKPSDPTIKAQESHSHKPKESTKVNSKAPRLATEGQQAAPVQPALQTSNILKVSNIPIEENSQEMGYFVKTCNHHIKKAIDVQYQRDHILFTFRNKEDATRAYTFMTDNNFSFKGKKVKVEYQLPVKKSSGDGIHVPKGGNQSQSIKKIESMPPNNPDIMQASNSSTDYKSMLQAAGYGSVAVFEPHNYDMNNLENVQSLPQNAFINSGSIQNNESPNLTMSGPQGLGLDYSNVTFNPGQKLQHSQDELDHLIKATEALQTEIGVPQDIFNQLKMESGGSMNSNQQQQQALFPDGINPMEHNFSLQNHPLNLASQKNQQRPESMGPLLSYPRENSVFGGQAPGRSSPSQEQQQPQLKGPQPPTSIQQSLAQFSAQESQSQFGRPPSKGGMNQQGPYPPQQFNPQFQGQNQQLPQNPPRLGSGPNLNQPIPQQPGVNNGPRLGTGNPQQMNQMNQMNYGNQPNPPQQQQQQQQQPFLGSQQQPPRIPTQPNSTGIPNLGSQGQLGQGPKESQANLGNLNNTPQQNQPYPPPHQFNQQQPQYPPNTQPQLHEEKQRQTGPQTESYKGSGPQQPNYQQQQQQGMYPPNQNYNSQWQNQQQPPNFNQDPNNFQPNQYHQQNPNYYPPQFNQNQPPYGNPQQYPQYPGPQGQQYPPQQGGQNQPQGGQGPFPGQWQGQGQYPPQNQGQQYPLQGQGQGPYSGQWQGQGQQYPPQTQQKQDQQQSQKSNSKSDKKQQQSSTQGQKDQKLGQQSQGQNQQQQQQGYYPPQQDYGMPPYYQGYPQYPPQNQGGNQNQGYYGGQNQGYNQRGNAPYPMYNQQMQGDVQRNGPQGFPNNPQYGGQHQNYPNPQQKGS